MDERMNGMACIIPECLINEAVHHAVRNCESGIPVDSG